MPGGRHAGQAGEAFAESVVGQVQRFGGGWQSKVPGKTPLDCVACAIQPEPVFVMQTSLVPVKDDFSQQRLNAAHRLEGCLQWILIFALIGKAFLKGFEPIVHRAQREMHGIRQPRRRTPGIEDGASKDEEDFAPGASGLRSVAVGKAGTNQQAAAWGQRFRHAILGLEMALPGMEKHQRKAVEDTHPEHRRVLPFLR